MRKLFMVFIGCLSVSACAPITTSVKQYTDTDYSRAEHYAWYDSDNRIAVDTPSVNRVAVGELIRDGIEKQLASKGLSESAAEEADLLVRFFATIEDVSAAEEGYGYIGDDPFATRGSGVTDVDPMVAGVEPRRLHDYDEGTLVVEILDGRTEQLVWRGRARSSVNIANERDAIENRVNKALEKLFREFPW